MLNCLWQLSQLLPNTLCIDCVTPVAAMAGVNVTAVSHFTCFTLSAGLRGNKMSTSGKRDWTSLRICHLYPGAASHIQRARASAAEDHGRVREETASSPSWGGILFHQCAHRVVLLWLNSTFFSGSVFRVHALVPARARVCVYVWKKWGRRGLMQCCQRSPHDEVVKAQGDGKKKKHNTRNTKIE